MLNPGKIVWGGTRVYRFMASLDPYYMIEE